MTKPPPSPPLIIYFQYFGGHKWFVRFDLMDWESKWEQAHWMKCENVWWLTCPVAIILFTLTAFNQFCRTLHLVINGDRHTNCFPSVENNRRLHLKLHLLYCSLRMHPIFCVKRLSWIGEPQPFQAKEGYVEYQRVNWRPNVHPMIRHILFVTYCIFISWGINEKKRLRYDRGPFVRFGDIVSNESRSVFTHVRSKAPDQKCERASWYKTQHEKMFFWKLLKGAALQRCAAVLKESEVIILGIIFPNNRLYCKICIWSGFISTRDVKKIHSSLSLYHPSIIRALSEFPNTRLAKIIPVHISHY